MASCRGRWLIAGFIAAVSLLPTTAFAAIPEAEPQSSRQFQVIPDEPPTTRRKPRSHADLRPAIVIRSEGVSAQIRQGFMRAAFCVALGFLGMIFIGYRAYNRRQGKAAT
jgi:hypothetical protein